MATKIYDGKHLFEVRFDANGVDITADLINYNSYDEQFDLYWVDNAQDVVGYGLLWEDGMDDETKAALIQAKEDEALYRGYEGAYAAVRHEIAERSFWYSETDFAGDAPVMEEQ